MKIKQDKRNFSEMMEIFGIMLNRRISIDVFENAGIATVIFQKDNVILLETVN